MVYVAHCDMMKGSAAYNLKDPVSIPSIFLYNNVILPRLPGKSYVYIMYYDWNCRVADSIVNPHPHPANVCRTSKISDEHVWLVWIHLKTI